MRTTKLCRRALVPVLGLVLLLAFAQAPTAADGIGRVTVTPTKVSAGSTQTFTFSVTADSGALDGQALLDVPSGWSPPQMANPGANGYIALTRGSCASGTKLLRVVGRRIVIATACPRGSSFTVTYGPAVVTTIAADGYVFLTQTRPATSFATKVVRKVVKTKKGKRRTKVSHIRVPVKPLFRALAPPKQPIVVVTGAGVDHLAVNAPSIVTSGTPFSITVRAEDVYGNAACCYTGTVSFSSSDPQAFLPTPYQFTAADLGSKTFPHVILRTVGAQTISATDNLGHTDGSNAINVYPFPTG